MTGTHADPETRLKRRTVTDSETNCWIWQGAEDGHGYGQINVGGRPEKTHRLGYMLMVGDIPDNLSVDHLCRVKLCWNPDHLELVTLSENTRRQMEAVGGHNSRKTHCPQGHPYDEANTRFASRGSGRVCRTCRMESNKTYRQRKQQQKENPS